MDWRIEQTTTEEKAPKESDPTTLLTGVRAVPSDLVDATKGAEDSTFDHRARGGGEEDLVSIGFMNL